MDPIVLILLLISAVSWTVVYIEAIRIGFRDRTCCMPLWALGLNICWEGIYALNGIAFPTVQAAANAVWFGCDVLIAVTWFRFGRSSLPGRLQPRFIPYSLLTFVSCLVLQLAFFLHFENFVEAAQYSAFAQNAAMSVLFVLTLCRTGNSRGQSMLIAVAKWLGTLAPTIQQGLVQGINPYILLTGLFCSVWDILYIVLLRRTITREERKRF